MSLLEYLKSLEQPERADFAKRCGTSIEYLFQIAYGVRKPKVELAISIAKESGGDVACEILLPDVDWKYLRKQATA